MKTLNDFYTDGEYLKNNPTWDAEDAVWKSVQLFEVFKRKKISKIEIVGEVGCGSGEILVNFSKNFTTKLKCFGYDISPQAIAIANKVKSEKNLENFDYKILSIPDKKSDLLLCVDVFEHIEDEFTFLRNIKDKSDYFLFNIPLDLSVQSIIREQTILSQRKRVGHVNYYTKNLALETLKDTGFEILAFDYGKWYKHYPANGIVTKVVNILRNILMPIAPDFCVKWLGGSSLIVLAK